MGVDLCIYRLRIGVFSMPMKCASVFHGLYMSGKALSMILRLAILLSELLTLDGDVEINTGPDRASAFTSSDTGTGATDINRIAKETESFHLSPAVTRSEVLVVGQACGKMQINKALLHMQKCPLLRATLHIIILKTEQVGLGHRETKPE